MKGKHMPIPHILHYCWFGESEPSHIEKKCMKTWKHYFKDYKIIKWNEDNFDVSCNEYVREAYEAKKLMYVSDFARLTALYKYGGLYLDTDCKVRKSLDNLMNSNIAFTGFGCDNKELAIHLLAFEPGNEFLLEVINSYENDRFVNADGSYNTKSINIRMSELLKSHGFIPNGKEQIVENIHIYSMTYFCPWSLFREEVPDCLTKDTYVEHIWKSKEFRREHRLYMKVGRKIGLDKLKRTLINSLAHRGD